MQCIGIDFGTTWSRIAWYNPRTQQAEILPNAEGEWQTPSLVYFGNETALVGTPAMRMADVSGDYRRLVLSIKRDLGRDSPHRFEGKAITPVEIAALILAKLKHDAEEFHFHEPVRAVVLTCPTSFSDVPRDRIAEAARLAGFEQIALIDEPTAVAIAYAHSGTEIENRLLIYDFGGGKLDVALLATQHGSWHPLLPPRGLDQYGGDDIDRLLYDFYQDRLTATQGQSLTDDGSIDLRFLLFCRQRKEALSSLEKVSFSHLPPLSGQVTPYSQILDRATFEQMLEGGIGRTITLAQDLIAEAGKEGIGTLLLTGGSSRIPLVERLLGATHPSTLTRWHHQPGAAALGAAYHGLELVPVGMQPRPAPPPTATATYQAGGRGLPAHDISPATPQPRMLDEDVQFTVYRPRVIQPERWYTMLAFAHKTESTVDSSGALINPLEGVAEQARVILGGALAQYAHTAQESSAAVAWGSELRFVPVVDGIDFVPPAQSVIWSADIHRAEFQLKAAARLVGRQVRGRLSVFFGAILISDLTLSFRVESTAPADEQATRTVDSSRRYRRIFASYSHRDLPVVEQFAMFIRGTGDEFVRDWTHLRSGEHWDTRLLDMIREADIFQLFWSANSMISPFVQREWSYALSLNRREFIRPVYWEDPMPSLPEDNLPPAELLRLHFHRLDFLTGNTTPMPSRQAERRTPLPPRPAPQVAGPPAIPRLSSPPSASAPADPSQAPPGSRARAPVRRSAAGTAFPRRMPGWRVALALSLGTAVAIATGSALLSTREMRAPLPHPTQPVRHPTPLASLPTAAPAHPTQAVPQPTAPVSPPPVVFPPATVTPRAQPILPRPVSHVSVSPSVVPSGSSLTATAQAQVEARCTAHLAYSSGPQPPFFGVLGPARIVGASGRVSWTSPIVSQATSGTVAVTCSLAGIRRTASASFHITH